MTGIFALLASGLEREHLGQPIHCLDSLRQSRGLENERMAVLLGVAAQTVLLRSLGSVDQRVFSLKKCPFVRLLPAEFVQSPTLQTFT